MVRNTRERWGSVSIGLHWIIAALILLVQVPAGLLMGELDPGTLQNVLYTVHKLTGLLVFVLAVIRLVWRLSHPTPALPAGLPAWQAAAGHATHWALYALILLLPITGYLYTALGGFPVPLGFVDLGNLLPVNKPLGGVFAVIHTILAFTLIAVAALHVAGALQHHLIRKDWVLYRMLSATDPLPRTQRHPLGTAGESADDPLRPPTHRAG